MEEIPVLTCPVCDRSAGFRDRTPADADALKDAAWDHLNAHRGLDEPKRAIYAVMMVERRDELTIPGDQTFDEPAGKWVDGLSQPTV